MLESTIQDIRYGARTLRKSPGFTAVAILTLALGIGANTTIFSVVQNVLLRTLPYREPGRLVEIWDNYLPQWPRLGLSTANFEDWQTQTKSFSEMGAYNWAPNDLNLTRAGETQRVEATYATAELFSTLGVKPALGRLFLPEEDKPGQAPVALVSHQVWETQLGGQPGAIGRTLTLDGKDYTLVGVLPANFRLVPWADVWFPYGQMDELNTRVHHPCAVVARLAPGATIAQAQAEMTTLAQQQAIAHPDTNAGWTVSVQSLRDPAAVNLRDALLVLFGAVGLVLLIACANLANLLLARNADRQRQFALRAALGASRRRLIAQLITEATLLAIGGGVLSIVIARAGLDALSALTPAEIAAAGPASLNGWVLAFTLGVSVLAGIFCGILPAFQSARIDLNGVLKGGGSGAIGGDTGKLGNAFVVAEIALSLILLVGAGLFLRGFGNLLHVDPGFRADHILTMHVSQASVSTDAFNKMTEAEQNAVKLRDSVRFQQLMERVERLPGVKSAAGISVLPIASALRATTRFAIEGHPESERPPRPTAEFRTISSGYFSTIGIPLVAGRALDDFDWSTLNIVINQSMARRFWPNGDAIGQRINLCPMDKKPCWSPIVGVVGNVHQFGLGSGATLDVYIAGGWTESLVIRTDRDPATLAPEARAEIQKFDASLAVSHVETMGDVLSESLAQQRFSTLLLGTFAVLAFVLAAVGIYGVVSYGVARRTREIGIRMALGAQPQDVSRMIIRRGLQLAFVGAAIGLAGALALARVIQSLLFEVKPADPLILGAVTLLLFGTVVAACYLPGRRAMRVDPMAALRQE